MPDYTFYVEDYLGEDIPEKEFPRFIRRAGDELRRMREMYAVAPRQGLDPELAESMALCAVADAMYEFAQEDEARGIAKVSVGSVSETYTAPPELCSRTLADRAAQALSAGEQPRVVWNVLCDHMDVPDPQRWGSDHNAPPMPVR